MGSLRVPKFRRNTALDFCSLEIFSLCRQLKCPRVKKINHFNFILKVHAVLVINILTKFHFLNNGFIRFISVGVYINIIYTRYHS